MATNYSPTIVTDGAVFVGDALMPSTATSATKLYNRAGSGDGTMYIANCVEFDGTDAYVTYGDVTWLDGLTVVSVSCWFYLDGDPPNSAGILVSKDNTLECVVKRSNGNEYSLSINNNHRVFASAPAPAYGEWIHAVYTWNSTGDVRKLYLNGALADTDTGGSQSGNPLANSSDGLAIGARANGSYEIDGKIADTKIFSKELSASQVKEMYENSKVIIPSNFSPADLALWAPLTDGVGTVAYDGSGRGRHGTYTGTSFSGGQTGAPQLIQGYNRPMLFDGSTDYVSIADSASLSVGSTFTISYWFYPESITTESYHVSKNTYSGNQKSYAVLQANSGKTQFRISGDGSSHIECTGSTTMSNKTWHHIVHVFDGSAGTKLKGWVDGTAQTFNQQPNVTGPYDSTSILCLGTRDAGLVAPLKGTINEVIIYNSALSDANATALFATGPNGGPLPPDPLSMSTSGNIVGYWRNDSNVTLTDLSGNSNTGTAVGSPSALLFKEGYNGQKNVNTGRDNQGFPLKYKGVGAMGFDGSSTYIEVPAPTGGALDITTSITLASWCFAASKSNWNRVIARRATASSALPYMLGLDDSTDQKWNFYIDGSSGATSLNSSGAASINTWVYVVGVLRGTSMQIYVNGVLDNSTTHSGGLDAGGTDPNVQIGSQLMPADTSYVWDGQIANAQIYNRGLSSAEILQNYNAQKSRFI